MPRSELEAWIPMKVGVEAVRSLNRPDLWRCEENPNRFEGDPQGSWLGDVFEVPLWLFTLSQALACAVYVPRDLTLAEAVRLVEHDVERQDGLAVIARLGVIPASDVVRRLIEWREESA